MIDKCQFDISANHFYCFSVFPFIISKNTIYSMVTSINIYLEETFSLVVRVQTTVS